MMKYILSLVIILSSLCLAPTTTEELSKQLLLYEQQLMDAIAIGDRAIWSTYLHDECIIVVEDGSTRTKAQFLEELNPLPAGYIGRIQVIEPTIKVHNQTAILSFIDDEYLELFNQNIHTQYRQTDTWMNFNGTWKIVVMQLFEIPKNPLPIAIDSTILQQYAGTYSLGAKKTCRVYVEKASCSFRRGQHHRNCSPRRITYSSGGVMAGLM